MQSGKLRYSNIDEYIALFPKEIQFLLKTMRTTISKAAPNATEKIAYQMPTFALYRNLVYFAAYKNHIGFYPGSIGVKVFQPELTAYKTSKGAIQFPLDQPLPLKLITKIVKFRVKEDAELQRKKQKPKTDSIRPSTRKEKSVEPTAKQFVKELTALKTKADLEKNSRFLHNGSKANLCLGVRMGKIFETAKKYKNMPLEEIAVLIKNPYYEIRMGAVSILDFLARDKKRDEKFKKRLFDLYIKNHKHINNWDLVDRSAGHVIGRFLFDKSREPLYKLARSKNPMERRTAIVSTSYFIMNKDPNETFRIAEILKDDRDETVQKAVGSWVREAGKKDKPRLLDFLNRHSATLPRITLRAAIERLDAKEKEFYLRSKKN